MVVKEKNILSQVQIVFLQIGKGSTSNLYHGTLVEYEIHASGPCAAKLAQGCYSPAMASFENKDWLCDTKGSSLLLTVHLPPQEAKNL